MTDLNEALDSEIRTLAIEKANELYSAIEDAMKDPTKTIVGEAKTVYDEVVAWNMLDDFPFLENRGLYITIFAMTQYRHLRWKKEHPVKEKKPVSKWEKVMGKSPRR